MGRTSSRKLVSKQYSELEQVLLSEREAKSSHVMVESRVTFKSDDVTFISELVY